MKKVKRFLASVLLLMLSISMAPLQTKAEPPVSVSFQFFYDNLSPYGSWVSYPSYGYVWIPRTAGFRPYCSGGHWVYTEAGWMWASDYNWGWAPFHYGSWLHDPYYGWLWVPGYDWAPAWVTWGYYSGYYGWAPLSPGVSFSLSYNPPINYWVFSSPRYITVSGNNNYYVYSGNRIPLDGNTSITNVKNINVIDNTGNYEGKKFNAGPSKTDFEKTANTKLNTASIREHDKPGKADVSGNAISVYRPKVDASDRKSAKPSKVIPAQQMKRSTGAEAGEPDKMKNNEAERKATPDSKAKERVPEKKAAPEQKRDVKEKQPEKQQPKMQERKPEVKEQPKQQEKKPEMKEPEQKKEAVPSQERTVKPQRQEKPDIERQTPYEFPKQNSRQQKPQQKQPQLHENHEKHNPK